MTSGQLCRTVILLTEFSICTSQPLKSLILFGITTNELIWAATWQNQQNDCAPSEDSDQPGHPLSLIRVFAVRMKKAWVLSYPLSARRRLWSGWADAQADLSFRWAHNHFVGFVMSRLIYHKGVENIIKAYYRAKGYHPVQPSGRLFCLSMVGAHWTVILTLSRDYQKAKVSVK